jgi:DNA-binding beta-propeller fold protein YncE
MKAAAVFLLVVTGAGCRPHGPWMLVDVVGGTGASLTHLRVSISAGEKNALLEVPPGYSRFTLPKSFVVEFPANTRDRIDVSIEAHDGAAQLARGAGSVLASDSQVHLTIRLEPSSGGDAHPCSAVVVSTFSGSGEPGYLEGLASSAQFDEPYGLAYLPSGGLLVADSRNHRIRRLDPMGNTQLMAGSGAPSDADGPAPSAGFFVPRGLAFDESTGVLYVADTINGALRSVDSSGTVVTLARMLMQPHGVARDGAGTIFVADTLSHSIRKLSRGAITTVAGSSAGYLDGATMPRFSSPRGIAVDPAGNLWIADTGNDVIRKISPDAQVSTVSGGTADDHGGFTDGPPMLARFNGPKGLCLDASGNLYVADTGNNAIRRVSADGATVTLAGSGRTGKLNGLGCSAEFNQPTAVACAGSGNLFVADTGNHTIRKLSF